MNIEIDPAQQRLELYESARFILRLIRARKSREEGGIVRPVESHQSDGQRKGESPDKDFSTVGCALGANGNNH